MTTEDKIKNRKECPHCRDKKDAAGAKLTIVCLRCGKIHEPDMRYYDNWSTLRRLCKDCAEIEIQILISTT